MQNTINALKTYLLQNDSPYAIDMLVLIEKKAAKDPDYNEIFMKWLKCGGTLLIRDELCMPFKNSSLIAYYKSKLPLPWDNMWIALDSAIIKVR